ncbi:MAG: M23 family metallopeptidase [Mariprofundaceae bacterium]
MMIARYPRWLLAGLLLFFSGPDPAHAQVWQVTQGDVLTIEKTVPDGKLAVQAWGISWPFKPLGNGRVKAWIGVDMKARAGTHALLWKIQQPNGHTVQQKDTIQVHKGEFRISRITVEKKMAEFDIPTLARIRADQKVLKQAYRQHVDARPEIRMLTMPAAGIMSTPFGAQRYVNGEPRSPHSGIDIAAAEGTPIMNPLAGKVLLVEDMYLNGHTVVIGHGHGLVSVFSHLKSVDVRPNAWIETGETIGQVGRSGRATGPHLHWGIRFYRARINPLSITAATVSTLTN